MSKKELVGTGWPFQVTKEDLEITFCRSSGSGGQNVNKRDTACQIRHIPTGIAVRAETHRTQERNKAEAFRKLCEKLVPIMKEAAYKKINKDVIVETARVRSYTQSRDQVVDERLEETFSYNRVLYKTDLTLIIGGLKGKAAGKKVKFED